jgi:hypothetical protein
VGSRLAASIKPGVKLFLIPKSTLAWCLNNRGGEELLTCLGGTLFGHVTSVPGKVVEAFVKSNAIMSLVSNLSQACAFKGASDMHTRDASDLSKSAAPTVPPRRLQPRTFSRLQPGRGASEAETTTPTTIAKSSAKAGVPLLRRRFVGRLVGEPGGTTQNAKPGKLLQMW